jgi:hypothetical protein
MRSKVREQLLQVATALLALAPAAAMGASDYFTVSAAFVPAAKPKATPSVAVTFSPADPDVRINQEPAPRLKLDPEQLVLVDRQPSAPRKGEGAGEPKYLDTSLPVAFPVALSPKAPKGEHPVRGTVTYFFCSKREGWCRKGTSEVDFTVAVR